MGINWDNVIGVIFLVIFILGFAGFVWKAIDVTNEREKICGESNGVMRALPIRCVNETGVYEVVELNNKWMLIRK